jgi:hypothetical protein
MSPGTAVNPSSFKHFLLSNEIGLKIRYTSKVFHVSFQNLNMYMFVATALGAVKLKIKNNLWA